ncbi:MAG: MFS transporter [Bryobacterales bacterium]|nr:MFS transporter [Bryobacterales bacterium]
MSPARTPPEEGLRHGLSATFRSLRHRNFRLFFIGQVISLVGTWMQSVAQSWLVYRLTHSELLLGTTWFCLQIPVFALGPLGGLVSDRYSRHRIVVITQVFSMIQALILAGLTLSGKVAVWHILVLAVLLGCINAFDMPARQALIIHMTSKKDLLSAISLNSAIFNAARMVGPGVAGMLVATLGEGICFLINGLSFLAVIAGLLAMRLPRFFRQNDDSPWAHLVGGFRFAYDAKPVRALLLMMATVTIAGMPALVLMPFFADAIFQRGSQGLGFLMASMGCGAVVGTLVLAARRQLAGLTHVIVSSVLILGVGFLLFAVSWSFLLSLAIMPVIGFSVVRQMASANTLIQTMIPDEYRGRIMAFYSMTVVGLGPFGSLASGAIAHAVGPRVTVFAGGLLCLAAAFIFQASARRIFHPAVEASRV